MFRHDWQVEEVLTLLCEPLDHLCSQARKVHESHGAADVQQCMLLSVKTGACPEDCGYCSQSAHFKTEVTPEALLDVPKVLEAAKEAKAQGATRFCMGAAWRQVPEDERFNSLLQMIEGVADLGIEVCCTFGMATESQLSAMREKGLTAYNHNLDTSRKYYSQIISTRTYEDRLNTLRAVRKAGVQICSGGILGMGESMADRAAWLAELANFDPHPESVPINLLVPIKGTPLENAASVPFEDFLRVVATARILMPRSRVRLSAGRRELTAEQQKQCFEVGANSIFIGEKLLTAPNVSLAEDTALLREREVSRPAAPR